MSNVKEAFFIARGIQIAASFEPAEEQTTESVFRKSVTKIKHGVGFAPVFTIFPNLNGSAAHFSRQFNQARIV